MQIRVEFTSTKSIDGHVFYPVDCFDIAVKDALLYCLAAVIFVAMCIAGYIMGRERAMDEMKEKENEK